MTVNKFANWFVDILWFIIFHHGKFCLWFVYFTVKIDIMAFSLYLTLSNYQRILWDCFVVANFMIIMRYFFSLSLSLSHYCNVKVTAMLSGFIHFNKYEMVWFYFSFVPWFTECLWYWLITESLTNDFLFITALLLVFETNLCMCVCVSVVYTQTKYAILRKIFRGIQWAWSQLSTTPLGCPMSLFLLKAPLKGKILKFQL